MRRVIHYDPARYFCKILKISEKLLCAIGFLLNVGNSLTHSSHLLGVFVRNINIEFFLESHNKFNDIEGIGAEGADNLDKATETAQASQQALQDSGLDMATPTVAKDGEKLEIGDPTWVQKAMAS